MTMKITEDCIACGACVPECPTESISEGDGILYVIDQG
ncbi:MAG: 4Fe-4S binding protein, partial [Anaerolineales bacterium]